MQNRPEFMAHFEKANQFDSTIHVSPEIFTQPIPLPRIVFRMSKDTTYNCNVWCCREVNRQTNTGNNQQSAGEVSEIARNALVRLAVIDVVHMRELVESAR